MKRFFKVWIASITIYVAGGYAIVASLYLLGFVGWSDGPSQPLLSASVPQTLQRAWAFGIFALPTLSRVVFTDAGRPPWIERDATPEQTQRYDGELRAYYQRVSYVKTRSGIVAATWFLIASAIITALYVLFRPLSYNNRNA